jgi:hypothetical protein
MMREVARTWGLAGLSAVAVVLIAAGLDPDASWARIRVLPMEQRQKLLKTLQRFDLELSAEKRQLVRDLDRQIAELDPARQAEYRAVLRRYHTWFEHLPENLQDELLNKPPAERMPLVRKLVAAHPVPKADTPAVLRLADLGEYSPFELASLYRIWEKMGANEREKVERLAQPRRRETLFRLGSQRKIPRETLPPGFDEEKWMADLEATWRQTRPLFLPEEVFKPKKWDEAIQKKFETRRREILRRQAINLFLAKTGSEVRSVDPGRLVQFLEGLPLWVQATLDQYPPDEARQRLSMAYRLVFPYPKELTGGGPRPAAPAKGPAAAQPKEVRPTPAKPKSDARTDAPF